MLTATRVFVRPFTPADVPEIFRIVRSRGAPEYASWDPAPGFECFVAGDSYGLAAVAIIRDMTRGLLGDVFEIEYEAGKPTRRGLRGGSLLRERICSEANKRGKSLLAFVSSPSFQASLKKHGWTVKALVLVAPQNELSKQSLRRS